MTRTEEVKRLVAAGYSNKEIAARTGLSVGTVKQYLFQGGVHDRVALIIQHYEQELQRLRIRLMFD